MGYYSNGRMCTYEKATAFYTTNNSSEGTENPSRVTMKERTQMKTMMTSVCVLALAAASASAATLNISGDITTSNGGTGVSFEGGLDYVFDGGTSGTLTVSLTNTTANTIGGYLTGFVFNIGSVDGSATASLASTTDADFLDTGVESASPYGMFDAGAALNANWNGGGSPSNGIAMGVTEIFVFSVSASDANALDSMSFVGLAGNDFAVRFRGLDNGGSDKLTTTVPAPGTGALALLGLGLASRRRR
jgi:uncharacterized protein (TIGR03382 family)